MKKKKMESEGENEKLSVPEFVDFESWKCGLLADYIVKKHHQYVLKAIAKLIPLVENVTVNNSVKNPELRFIKDLFYQLSNEIQHHMRKEELVLFPYIKKLDLAESEGRQIDSPFFKSIKSPVSVMEAEHETVSLLQEKLFKLTNGYKTNKFASPGLIKLYVKLNEFSDDMNQHVYLENKVLFPKAIEMERAYLAG